MTITTIVIVISIVGLLVGIATVYLAIWSKYGLGEKIEKGFGDLRISGSAVAHDIDKRMGDLVEIIRMLVPQKGTVTYELKNIGTVAVSIFDRGGDKTNYNIKAKQPIFTSRFLTDEANGSKQFREKEIAFFGEQETSLTSPIPTILSVMLPSVDEEKCSKFMAFLLKWLDTEYFENWRAFAEAESAIGKYLES